MRYKGFTVSLNPTTLKIECENETVLQTLPFKGQRCDEIGTKCRTVKGEGELWGENCLQRYAELYALYKQKGSGVLSLPLAEPMYALFTKLSLKADTAPDKIIYSFEFKEEKTEDTDFICSVHRVKEGEGLFDIAYFYNVPVEKLVELNPQIKRPDELTKGEEIKLC